MSCIHNARSRNTDGYLCRDCGEFVSKDSEEYRKNDLLDDYHMALHNGRVELYRKAEEITELMDEIGIGKVHANYEELICKAEALIKKYKGDVNSIFITLG